MNKKEYQELLDKKFNKNIRLIGMKEENKNDYKKYSKNTYIYECSRHGIFEKTSANIFQTEFGCTKYGKYYNIKRMEETNLIKYGSLCSLNDPAVKEKSIKTLRKNYGVDSPSKSKIIQKRIQNTIQKEYGVDFLFQNEEIKSKIIETKKKNKTISSSRGQDKMREILYSIYKDLKCEYIDKDRYPYLVTFIYPQEIYL